MAKVNFYFYQHSPRIHINHTEEMEIAPNVGDVIGVINHEFYSLNKDIKKKNFFIRFKVAEREFRMIHKDIFYCDVKIKLELLIKLR